MKPLYPSMPQGPKPESQPPKPESSKKSVEPVVSIAEKLSSTIGTPDSFVVEMQRFAGMAEEMRNKAIENKGRILEAKSGEVSRAIAQIDAQINSLHPSKGAAQRIDLGAERRKLEALQQRIDDMVLKLDEFGTMNVGDTLATSQADDLEMKKTTEFKRVRVGGEAAPATMITEVEQNSAPRDEFSPFFDDMIPVREVKGITYGEFSSATTEESPKEHFSKEMKTDIGHIGILTNTGGEKSKYQSNEDATFAISEKDRVVVGAIDGMGGGGLGKVSGRIVTSVFEKNLREGSGVKALEKSRAEIIQQFKENPLVAGRSAGACGVVAEITKSASGDFNVNAMFAGDSKMLTIQDGAELAEGTTKSQNAVSEGLEQQYKATGIDERHEYFAHPLSHHITGSFTANRSQKLPEIISFTAKPGARSILASDGLWDNVSHHEVIKLSEEHPDDEDFRAILFSLAMERNNSNGEKFDIEYAEGKTTPKKLKAGDNITIAVVRYGGEALRKPEAKKDTASQRMTETQEFAAEAKALKKSPEITREIPKAEAKPEKPKLEPLSPAELAEMTRLEKDLGDLETANAELDQNRREQRLSLTNALEAEQKALVDRQMYMKPWQRWMRLDFRSDAKFDELGAAIVQKKNNLDTEDEGLKKLNDTITANTREINQMRYDLDALRRRAQANKQ